MTKPQKQCPKCKRRLPADLEHFYKKSKAPDGLHYWCRKCAGEYGVEWKKKNKDTVRKHNVNYRRRVKNRKEFMRILRSEYPAVYNEIGLIVAQTQTKRGVK